MGIIGFIIVLLVVNGSVSFALAKFIRAPGLAIVASAIITILLFLLLGINSAMNAEDRDFHDVLLAINIMLIFVVPGVIGTSVGFVILSKRSNKNGDPSPDRRL